MTAIVLTIVPCYFKNVFMSPEVSVHFSHFSPRPQHEGSAYCGVLYETANESGQLVAYTAIGQRSHRELVRGATDYESGSHFPVPIFESSPQPTLAISAFTQEVPHSLRTRIWIAELPFGNFTAEEQQIIRRISLGVAAAVKICFDDFIAHEALTIHDGTITTEQIDQAETALRDGNIVIHNF